MATLVDVDEIYFIRIFLLSEIIVVIVRIPSNAAAATDNPTISKIIIARRHMHFRISSLNNFVSNHRWNYCIWPFGKNLDFHNFCPLKMYLKMNVSVVKEIKGNEKRTTKKHSITFRFEFWIPCEQITSELFNSAVLQF